MKPKVREATHWGSWYQKSKKLLEDELRKNLAMANIQAPKFLKAIISPHAGYTYSGPTAAFGFRYIELQKNRIKRVFVIGPSHFLGFSGSALSDCHLIETPFGFLETDREIIDRFKASKLFSIVDKKDEEEEHSLEMQYPYLKLVLHEGTKIIPIMVGTTNELETIVNDLLMPYFLDKDSLFVISSDFCHWGKRFNYMYHDKKNKFIYQSIKELDLKGVEAIKSKNRANWEKYIKETGNTVCGKNPISFLCYALQQNADKFDVDLLDYTRSDDVESMESSSVSYIGISVSI